MELFQLKYFLTVARFEHVTKAAESLHVAQPAVSQAIRHLEEELDVSLFDRENHHIALNSNGKYLQNRLLPIMSALDSLPEDLKEASLQNHPVIHMNLRSASAIITNCIIAYRAIHPEIRFKLSQKPEDPTADYFISAVRCDTELLPSQHVLFEEDFYLAVPANSKLASHPSVKLEKTANESYVSLESNRPLRTICDLICQSISFTPNIVYESDNPETVRDLIAAGLGVGFWPQYCWKKPDPTQVALVPIDNSSCCRKVVASIPKASTQNPAIMEFHTYLTDWINKNLISGN
ncbi:LysR family transcriptional regulator [Roseburia sp. AM59-24XD]|jgi:LysR family transcriptional activator of glutamate synthase operon|uniref:LysR family transcriptional regulator n=1 Tax=Roseburia sp. AM59-24XD TaxID=2293138 RepID=UPI000E524710|nr:LysR family transcriptional regulator [Roseburia sp. AM59-24XD]RHP86139.1 LysR family transcriptional regulator [Roseburia sp. AM59-24XD]